MMPSCASWASTLTGPAIASPAPTMKSVVAPEAIAPVVVVWQAGVTTVCHANPRTPSQLVANSRQMGRKQGRGFTVGDKVSIPTAGTVTMAVLAAMLQVVRARMRQTRCLTR